MAPPSPARSVRRWILLSLTAGLALSVFLVFALTRSREASLQVVPSTHQPALTASVASAPQHAAPPPSPSPNRSVPNVSVVPWPSAPAPDAPVAPKMKSRVEGPEAQERLSPSTSPGSEEPDGEGPDDIKQRMDWFYSQRAFPNEHIPSGARLKALQELDNMIETQTRLGMLRPDGTDPAIINFPGPTAAWTLIGPQSSTANLGANFGNPFATGRVTALAVDQTDPSIVYMGGAQGGVWKSTDGGSIWAILNFDNLDSLAIGSIAIAPSDHNTLYVGTGEGHFSGDSYYGAGVMKSTNAGATWTQLCGGVALGNAFCSPTGPSSPFGGGYYIASVAVHPTNPNIVLIAVHNAFSPACPAFTARRTAEPTSPWSPLPAAPRATPWLWLPTARRSLPRSVDSWAGPLLSASISLPTAASRSSSRSARRFLPRASLASSWLSPRARLERRPPFMPRSATRLAIAWRRLSRRPTPEQSGHHFQPHPISAPASASMTCR